MSRLLGRENQRGPRSRADRGHFVEATHWVALNRTKLIGKDGFLTNERVDISDKAFPIGQFLGDPCLHRGAIGRIDLGQGNPCQPG